MNSLNTKGMFEKSSLENIFSRFAQLKVLIIGDVMVDSYLWGKVDRISPEAPVPIVSLTKRESRPGGAANVALNVQALGAEAIICSVIGSDLRSDEFIGMLKEHHLSSKAVIKSKNRVTTTKFRIIGNSSHLLRVDEETDKMLDAEESRKLLAMIEKQMDAGIDAVIFEDYDKGVINPEVIRRVAEMAEARHIPVTADPKKRNFLHYAGITLFKPNLKELREGLKLDGITLTQQGLDEVLFPFVKKNKFEMAMITLSEAGVYICFHKNAKEFDSVLIPAHIRSIADVSGAGDTVIAVTTLCLASGMGAAETAALANLAGGLVCEEVGVVPVEKKKLFQEALVKFTRAK